MVRMCPTCWLCHTVACQYHRRFTHLAARDMVRYPFVEYLLRQAAMKGGYICWLKLSLIKQELEMALPSLQDMTMGYIRGMQVL